CSLRRRRLSRSALAKRSSRAARSVFCLAPGFSGCVIPRCKGRAPAMSSSTLILHPDLRMRREDHRDRLLCGVFGALIRMLAPPRLDTRPVTFHRGASGAARRREGLQYRFGGHIRRRIDFRYTPNHQALQKLTRKSLSWIVTDNLGNIRLNGGFRLVTTIN